MKRSAGKKVDLELKGNGGTKQVQKTDLGRFQSDNEARMLLDPNTDASRTMYVSQATTNLQSALIHL